MGILGTMTVNFNHKDKEQYPVYLDEERKWHPRQISAEQWEIDFHGFTSRVFFLEDGRIGIVCDGLIIVKSIEEWIAQDIQLKEAQNAT